MWSAILFVCLESTVCQVAANPRFFQSEKECVVALSVGAKWFEDKGWSVRDGRCIEWNSPA